MKKQKISDTNPYIRDRSKRSIGVFTSVCSSSAVEGIEAEKVLKDYLSKKNKKSIPRKPSVSDQ